MHDPANRPDRPWAGVDAVVFDKDGTLIDVHATWGPATAAVLRDLASTETELQQAASALHVDVEREIVHAGSPVLEETNAELAARIGRALGRVDDPLLAGDLDRLVRHHAARSVVGLPGVGETLATLAERGMWLGIATNDAEGCARDQMDQLGWIEWFDNIFGYDSGHGGKPDPGMITASLVLADCSPQHAVYVGDTATDMAAGRAAGLRRVLLYSPRGEGVDSDAVVLGFGELTALLNR